MTIQTFPVNPLGVNCHVLSDSTREGVIIDCGTFGSDEWQQVEAYIEREGILLRHALQTHLHFDHIFGLDHLHDRYGLTALAHPAERAVWQGNHDLLRRMGGRFLPQMPATEPDYSLADGQLIQFGHTQLRVIHTPGHTPGGLCFYCEAQGQSQGQGQSLSQSQSPLLFSGDTLFLGSYGRYDLPGGSYPQLMQSITSRLLTLPSSTRVLPGHGPQTTLAREIPLYI